MAARQYGPWGAAARMVEGAYASALAQGRARVEELNRAIAIQGARVAQTRARLQNMTTAAQQRRSQHNIPRPMGALRPPPPDPAESAELRREQQAFKPPSGGGLYADFGLGIGPGFNLHIDRNGVSPSVGGGFFGRAKFGYALSDEALEDAARENNVFFNGPAGGLEWNYGDGTIGANVGAVSAEINPRTGEFGGGVVAGRKHSPDLSLDNTSLELGFDLGGGLLHTLNGGRRRPRGK